MRTLITLFVLTLFLLNLAVSAQHQIQAGKVATPAAPPTIAWATPTPMPVPNTHVVSDGQASGRTATAPVLVDDPFVGTWQAVRGSEQLELRLTRDTSNRLANGEVVTMMTGRHRLTRDGVVIEESFTPTEAITLLGVPSATQVLQVNIFDLTKQKWGVLTLTLTTADKKELRWQLAPKPNQVTINSPTPKGYTLPWEMILTKVE